MEKVRKGSRLNGQVAVFEEIPVAEIALGNYQRTPNASRVRVMAQQFDPDRMRPIEVSRRNGKYYAWDGQHRLLMYKMLGFNRIPAMVHYDLTYEQEARLFAKQNENVARVRAGDRWNAMIESNDPVANDIVRIARSHGYTVTPSRNGNNANVGCVFSLLKAYERLGHNYFDRLFTIMENSFGASSRANSKEIVEGLTEFILAYDGDPSKPALVDYRRAYNKFKEAGADELIRAANVFRIGEMAKSCNMGKRMAKAMTDAYNKQLRYGRLYNKFLVW